MAEIETLTLQVDTSQIGAATKALTDLADALERVRELLAKPISITLAGPRPRFDAASLIGDLSKAAKRGYRLPQQA